MLISADRAHRRYQIALNNASGLAELMADFTYLEVAPPGTLTLDFRHMAAPLTQEQRLEYLPGNFGYEPTPQLLEIIAAIAGYIDQQPQHMHAIEVILPSRRSRVGRFLADMRVQEALQDFGCAISYDNPATAERGDDDPSRQNLIPITRVAVSGGQPDFRIVRKIRERVKHVFAHGLPNGADTALPSDLADSFAGVVSEAVDNMIEYGEGGVIGGLYYRTAGEVEITLVNRCGGFGGQTPEEQLQALLDACEGKSRRAHGGGNGVVALTNLATTCFGTLVFRNGNAQLRLEPTGSVVGMTDDLGIALPGAAVTLLLQLIPASSIARNDAMQAYEVVLRDAFKSYMEKGPLA